jgi:hypothetical protein
MRFSKIKTAFALGLPNLGRVLVYRLGIRVGVYPVRCLDAAIPLGDFFGPVADHGVAPPGFASQRWWHRQDYFGWFQVDDPSLPHWHRNPFTGAEVLNPERPWWQIPDFDASLGDIKTIWEASRFDWVLTFAQHACLGQPEGLKRLNAWLADWVAHNPPYRGPNWKCGQEASIRVLHLAVAALLLGQVHRPTPALVGLLVAHLRRIAPTLQYAIAQDNNHGTSEAAALFIGGSWLATLGGGETASAGLRRGGDGWKTGLRPAALSALSLSPQPGRCLTLGPVGRWRQPTAGCRQLQLQCRGSGKPLLQRYRGPQHHPV